MKNASNSAWNKRRMGKDIIYVAGGPRPRQHYNGLGNRCVPDHNGV